MKRLPVALACASLLPAACTGGGDPQQMHGTLERDRLELVAESNERIVELPLREGERAAAGSVVLRQEAGTMQPRLEQARALTNLLRKKNRPLRAVFSSIGNTITSYLPSLLQSRRR